MSARHLRLGPDAPFVYAYVYVCACMRCATGVALSVPSIMVCGLMNRYVVCGLMNRYVLCAHGHARLHLASVVLLIDLC